MFCESHPCEMQEPEVAGYYPYLAKQLNTLNNIIRTNSGKYWNPGAYFCYTFKEQKEDIECQ